MRTVVARVSIAGMHTMTKGNMGRTGFVLLTLSHCRPFTMEVGSGFQYCGNPEAGATADITEMCSLLAGSTCFLIAPKTTDTGWSGTHSGSSPTEYYIRTCPKGLLHPNLKDTFSQLRLPYQLTLACVEQT